MREFLKPINSQVVHPPLYVTPPISVKQPRTLREVNLLRGKRVLEVILLTNVPSIAMETDTSKLRSRLLENLDWVLATVIPVMVVCNELRASKSVTVHQRPQRPSNVRLLSRGKETSGVCRVAVLRLVLDSDSIGGNPLVLEALQ